MAERRSTRRAGSGGTATRTRSKAAAPGIDRDYADVEYREDDIYEGPEPTKGLYRLELVAVGDHETQDGNESVKWTFRIMDGELNKHEEEVAGWKGRKYTTESSAWVEQKIAVALGLIKPGGKLKMSYEEILKRAKPCRGLVVMERYIPEDGDPEWRPALASSFLPDTGAAKARKTRDDEDEEDEEDTPPPSARGRRSRKADPEPDEPDDEDEEEEGDEDDEGYDIEELEQELGELSLAALKKRAREEFEIKITRGMDADAIIDAILDKVEDEQSDDEGEEDEPEEEPEPEPAKRPRRGAAASSGASKAGGRRTSGKRGFDDEPPF